MGKEIKVWYDQEGAYLEVILEKKEGYFRETENDAVMEKVDKEKYDMRSENVVGVTRMKKKR